MTTTESQDTLFARLLEESSNPRQKDSLSKVKKAADYLDGQRMKISAGAIERYCIDHEWGGPKAQSIRNSKLLTHYVKARAAGQRLEVGGKNTIKKPLIPDETLRAYVQLLEDERDQAIASRRRIERGLRNLPGIPVDEIIRSGFGQQNPVEDKLPTAFRLPSMAKEALNIFFDENALESVGLQFYKDRVRHKITFNVLLQKHHVAALRELLQSTDKESSDKGSSVNKVVQEG